MELKIHPDLQKHNEKHEVRRVLQNIYKRVEFWFHEVDLYRNREKELIKKYQPKFNTQWR
jgi:hypothetical protein